MLRVWLRVLRPPCRAEVGRRRMRYRSGHPEGEDRVHSVRLRLERVGVEGGTVVFDFQFVQPIEVVMHETGTEANRLPFPQVVVDLAGVLLERCFRPVELAVVIQVMDTDFKTVTG